MVATERGPSPILPTLGGVTCELEGAPPDLSLPFDFAVLRFAWVESDGRDLDTRTAIVNPPRNGDVGWARGSSDGAFLTWGGDNTTDAGVEAILIDFNALAAAYPNQTSFTIRLRAFWYGEGYNPSANPPRSGQFAISFSTYLGGAMQQDGFDFINVGGALRDDVSLGRISHTDSVGDNVDGDDMASLVYNAATKTAQILTS